MKTIAPDYYTDFSCIADRCRHSCCAGWEIDVDPDSLARYQALEGPLGEELRENIVSDEEGQAHFRLGPEERCPFLNEKNLCRLILGLGEDALCQICTDHPRFRNEFLDRDELGLGLCCEAAGALILGHEEKTALVVLEDDGLEEDADAFEVLLTRVRERAFAIVQDRTLPVGQRVERLLEEFRIRMPRWSDGNWADFLLSLERMDSAWERELLLLKESEGKEAPLPARFGTAFEQLLVYLIYRHLFSARDESELTACLGFAAAGFRILSRLCALHAAEGGCSFDGLVELARLYSSEIEYSEENTDALIRLLWEENNLSSGT